MNNIYDYQLLCKLSALYGDAFYIVHTEQFRSNFLELKSAFQKIYQNFNIAYSYKTNYTPRLCQIVNQLGGYAEVVSDMEVNIALKSGVSAEHIIFNGPYKNPDMVKNLLLLGGTVNIDNTEEVDFIKEVASTNPDKKLSIGVRINFDINDGVLSRFGIDAESAEMAYALDFICNTPNVYFSGIHCHFAERSLDSWSPRVNGVLHLIDKYGLKPERVDCGGGLFGKMSSSLREQFNTEIPSYSEYAQTIAKPFAEHFGNNDSPLLLIEPGSALVGDCLSLVTRVQSIKTIRKKAIATLLASMYNINMGKKNPPLTVIGDMNIKRHQYDDIDFSGFTCIESDYLYRHYCGTVEVGDFVVIDNVGSYSIVFKPPFILPNFPIVELRKDGGSVVVKRGETFEDLFRTYDFEFED